MDYIPAILLLFGLGAVFVFALRNPPYDEPDEEYTDFDLMSVREKIRNVWWTSDAIEDLEQLQTDLKLCDPRTNVKAITLSWIGDDDENHEYTILCDGVNLNTEAIDEIAEREIYELRADLSYKTAVLSECTRSGKNGGKNVRFQRGR